MIAKTLMLCSGASKDAAEKWAEPITSAMHKFDISTPLRQSAFICQISHESGRFKYVVENLNYSANALIAQWPNRFSPITAAKVARHPEQIANIVYAGRMGNTEPGDGWKYRGRGLIQVTGKTNYAACGGALGLDLVNRPELLEQPQYAALSAAWFWSVNGLNTLADAGDLRKITQRINGGQNGAADRAELYARALKVLA